MQIKTVNFTMFHQETVVIIFKTADSILLGKLHFGKTDILISGSHMHFSDS